jgi:O-acetyl-ADP-ribose deacetylase (regulator of RNase III)
MKIIYGDLLALASEGRFDVIVHGCNCQCQMGAGIAKAIRERFPAAYAADLATAKGDRAKLGTYSQATIETMGSRFVLVNAYTQFHWRGPGVKADYDAIERVMRAIARDFAGLRIGYPKIGAGLAGGDWTIIAPRLDAALEGRDHALVLLPP